MRVLASVSATAATTAALVCTLAPAHADSPPHSWSNERILNCGGRTVDTYLTPAGFGSPYHLVGSSQVIVPKHVEVVFPGQTDPVTTLETPGFDKNAKATVDCTYTDPTGLFVRVVGLLS
ncbi:MAG: hypothetical protein QOK15_3085 [Nocardioidaceae bacterium]|nr:hypothetical protein [Nocardioidaceae bacterium]